MADKPKKPDLHAKPWIAANHIPKKQYSSTDVGLSYASSNNQDSPTQNKGWNKVNGTVEEEKKRTGFKHFSEFDHMEDGDIVVTIEHCNQCQHHQDITWHDIRRYTHYVDKVKCGILKRFPSVQIYVKPVFTTRYTGKHESNDRLGAFEVQLAQKEGRRLKTMLIHSKLRSKVWPDMVQIYQQISTCFKPLSLSVQVVNVEGEPIKKAQVEIKTKYDSSDLSRPQSQHTTRSSRTGARRQAMSLTRSRSRPATNKPRVFSKTSFTNAQGVITFEELDCDIYSLLVKKANFSQEEALLNPFDREIPETEYSLVITLTEAEQYQLNQSSQQFKMDLESAFQKACRLGDIATINNLVSRDPTLRDTVDENIGWSPLYRTVICGNLLATSALLALGANPDLLNKMGQSWLHTAVDSGYSEITREICEAKADINLQNAQGNTPLHLAVLRGDLTITQILLSFGADGNITNEGFEKTPLHYAVELCYSQIAEILVQHGSDPLQKDANGKSSLEFALTPEIQKILVDPESARTRSDGSCLTTASGSIGLTSPHNRNTDSVIEFIVQDTGTGAELYCWLQRYNLEHLTNILMNAGYDDIFSIVEQMNSDMPLTDSMLQKIGVTKPGNRHHLLSRLYDEAAGDAEEQADHQPAPPPTRRIFNCGSKPNTLPFAYNAPKLRDWLIQVHLGIHYNRFAQAGYDTLEDLLYLMGTSTPISDEILIRDVGVEKQGHRQRILFRLQQEYLAYQKTKPSLTKVESPKSCQSCLLMQLILIQMATEYLVQLYQESEFKAPWIHVSHQALEATQFRFQTRFMDGSATVKPEKIDVNIYIDKYKSKAIYTADVESNIREHKLKEAAKIRQELEARLNSINSEINTLEDQKPSELSPPRINHAPWIDPQARQEHNETEEKKVQEAKKFISSVRLARKHRENQHKLVQEKHKIRLTQSMELNDQKGQAIEEVIAKEKRMRLTENVQSIKQRQKEGAVERQVRDKEFRKQRNKMPYYQQIQEHYKRDVLMPELERRKKEMAAIRQSFNSVDYNQIAEHAKQYKKDQKERELRRQKLRNLRTTGEDLNEMSNTFHARYVGEFQSRDKELMDEKERKQIERAQLRVKANRYSKVVSDLYKPHIDEQKAMEMRLVKERAQRKAQQQMSVQMSPQTSERTFAGSTSPTGSHPYTPRSEQTFRPRAFKPNPLAISSKKVRKTPKVIDYLADQRRERGEEKLDVMKIKRPRFSWDEQMQSPEISHTEKVNSLQQKAKVAENEIRKQELLLKEASAVNRDAIVVEEHVNDLLLDTIKAKLALLEQVK